MYYYADSNKSSNYRFIYDDTDKSVELCSMYELSILGISVCDNYWLAPINYKRGSSNWSKLKFVGFTEGNSVDLLERHLCSYTVNDIKMRLTLRIDGNHGTGYLFLYRHYGWFTSRAESISRWYDIDDAWIKIFIPDIMISYVLNIVSERDFDALMRCVNDFLGSRITDLVSDFGDRLVDVSLLEWF